MRRGLTWKRCGMATEKGKRPDSVTAAPMPQHAPRRSDTRVARLYAVGESSFGAEVWAEHHGTAEAGERWRLALANLTHTEIRNAWRRVLRAHRRRPPTIAEFVAAARGDVQVGPRTPVQTERGRAVLTSLRAQLTGVRP